MNEDDVYRATTQYRLWSYTPESLAALRRSTNELASQRVIAAIKRTRTSRATKGGSTANGHDENNLEQQNTNSEEPPIDCLTVLEEQKLVEYYSSKCLSIGTHFAFPTVVKSTAVQYLKRFYLSNSPMTYHPRQIFPTALFLATKTENHIFSLTSFAAKFPKTTNEDVVAPEFLLMQGLRFTFDVRHPHRSLRGGLLELLSMARGEAALLPGMDKSAKAVQQDMMALPPAKSANNNAAVSKQTASTKTAKGLETRCLQAWDRAKETLSEGALLTDAYFLYTPAQIWLAALLLADEPVTLFFLSTKFPTSATVNLPSASTSPDATATALNIQYARILSTIRACATLLSAYISTQAKESRDELVRIDKKLYQCQNPEKRDLVGLNRAQKRDGDDDADVDGRAAKKRRLEREEAEKDDVFGGSLGEGGGRLLEERGAEWKVEGEV